MERPRRVSIGTLCVLVAVVALDFAWWRQIAGRPGSGSLLGFRGPALDAGAMPMASLLVVGLAYMGSNWGRVPRRVVGFLSGGLAGLLLYLAYNWSCRILPYNLFYKTMEPIYLAKKRWPRIDSAYYLYYADMVYYGLPQFLLASTVGLICWKDKPAGSEDAEACPAGSSDGILPP